MWFIKKKDNKCCYYVTISNLFSKCNFPFYCSDEIIFGSRRIVNDAEIASEFQMKIGQKMGDEDGLLFDSREVEIQGFKKLRDFLIDILKDK